MFSIKSIVAAAALTTLASAPAFAGLQEFAGGTAETLSISNGVFNVGAGASSVSINIDQLNTVYSNVTMQIGGGSGVAVGALQLASSNACLNGATYGCFFTTAATTLSYTFSSPVDIDGVYVTNLATITLAAGVEIDVNKQGRGANYTVSIDWEKQYSDITGFSSDLFKFTNFSQITNLIVGFTLTSVTPNGAGIASGFSATGSSSFSSDPLPTVPEAPSAALLVIGMTAVAMGARRRSA